MQLPSGARFYCCALQVNPYAYLVRHGVKTRYADEASYNAAIVEACMATGVEIIGITDHYRISSATSLIDAATSAGITVFPGFEAVTKDGVHFLCLLDPGSATTLIQAKISDCGVHDESLASPIGKYDAVEFLEECRQWRAACIAAHATSGGGLLTTLSGQARVNAWRHSDLLACSLPGPVATAPAALARIIENLDAAYKRPRKIAVVNSQDVSDPADLRKPGAVTWIKMSAPTAEGLRQSFLDSESRVRLTSDQVPEEHAVFVAMAWEGGFLDGCALHFNENLNVLIGGRGAGKSSVVESLRYVLHQEPIADDSRKTHDGIVKQVLKNGTKISLLVESHRPDKRQYLIERTVPNPPHVRDLEGNVLPLAPRDVLPRVEVLGQHEIAALARSAEQLTHLLARFLEPDSGLAGRKAEIHRKLELSRQEIFDVRKQRTAIDDRLAGLPTLETTLRRYKDAGLDEKLKEQSSIVSEEQILNTADSKLVHLRADLARLEKRFPIDRTFVGTDQLEGLPGGRLIQPVDRVLERLSTEGAATVTTMRDALDRAATEIAAVRSDWAKRRDAVREDYARILRELQTSKVDGEEYLGLRRQAEEIRPLIGRSSELAAEEAALTQVRRNLLVEREDITRQEFLRLNRAAQRVSTQLSARVRVHVTYAGDCEPVFALLKEKVGGRLGETIDVLRKVADFSPSEFANACRAGKDALIQRYSIPPSQAERVSAAAPDICLLLEEMDLPATTDIQLNVAAEGQEPNWRSLDGLSTGQKATAVLLLLLLEADAPLVIDQPEDDLDNRFITEGIVPKLREEKRRRQFVLATHNANIPVLGDAELILSLTPAGDADQGKSGVAYDHMGSIDNRKVREAVEDILEGGKDAFEMRRLKYGF